MTSAREGGCHFECLLNAKFKKYVNSLVNSGLIRNFAV